MNVKNYEEYLDFLTTYIDNKFENQKEYIACKRGCAKCCQTTTVPFSTLEFEYLMEGFKTLSEENKEIVRDNIRKIKNDSEIKSCPFLINNECSVYKYRGLICRTFGLLIISDDESYTLPFCIHDGLNYANVYDEETNTISEEKYKNGNFNEPPKFFRLHRNIMCNLEIVKELDLHFGISKPLYEWIIGLNDELS